MGKKKKKKEKDLQDRILVVEDDLTLLETLEYNLRAEGYEDAVALFKAALSDKGNDHRAAFGAGVACEAAGRYDEALSFYRRACAGRDDPAYREARDRMKTYGHRVRH